MRTAGMIGHDSIRPICRQLRHTRRYYIVVSTGARSIYREKPLKILKSLSWNLSHNFFQISCTTTANFYQKKIQSIFSGVISVIITDFYFFLKRKYEVTPYTYDN